MMYDRGIIVAPDPTQSQPLGTGFVYDVFLSYSTDPDYKLARHVEAFLESFHLLKNVGDTKLKQLNACRDGSDFSLRQRGPAVSSLDRDHALEIIHEELAKSDKLLVICSANACASEFVNAEVEWFLEHRPSEILIAVSEGEEPMATPDLIFPRPLVSARRHRGIWYDFREFKSRDAKAWKKVRSFDDECVQLACHLNGASLGKIRPVYFAERQKTERRQRRIATAVAIIFGVLAVLAGVFWRLSETARIRAEQQGLLALGRATAVQALRLSERSLDDAASLLARQSYLFHLRSGQPIHDADDALRRTLSKAHFSHRRVWTQLYPNSPVFSADRQTVVMGVGDDLVLINLSVPHAEPRKLLTFEERGIGPEIAVSEHARHVVASIRESLYFVETSTGKVVRHVSDPVSSLRFVGDSGVVLLGADGALSVANARDWIRTPYLTGVRLFTTDRRGRIAALMKNNEIRVWHHLAPGDPVKRLSTKGKVLGLSFDNTANRLVALIDPKGIDFWDLAETNPQPRSVPHPVDGQRSLFDAHAGGMIAGSITDPNVYVWRTWDAEPLQLTLNSRASAAVFDVKRDRMIAVSQLGDVRLWELLSTGSMEIFDSQISSLQTPSVSADANILGAAGHSEIILWDVPRRAIEYASPPDVWESVSAVDPRGRWFAASGQIREEGRKTPVYLWEPGSLKKPPHHEFSAGNEQVHSLVFDGNGDRLAAGDAAGAIRIWRVADRDVPQVLLGHAGVVKALRFTKSGRTLFSGSSDGTVRIWSDLANSSKPLVIRVPNADISSIALSADERTLAAGAENGGVYLWDLKDGVPSARRVGPMAFNTMSAVVAFSDDRDSRWLAAGSRVGSGARLWDWRNPDSAPLILPDQDSGNSNITGLVFTRNGKRLVTSAGTSDLRMWIVEAQELADLVCEVVDRNFSEREWSEYIGEAVPYEATCGSKGVGQYNRDGAHSRADDSSPPGIKAK